MSKQAGIVDREAELREATSRAERAEQELARLKGEALNAPNPPEDGAKRSFGKIP